MYRPDLEEDYEALYPDGWRPDPYEKLTIPVGLCHHMCSYQEMQEREQHRRLSKYETEDNVTYPPKVDFKLAIKEFKRSCVGREFTSVMDLRPWSVLKRTLHHLLLTICFQEDDWMFICDFVFDRLKAVRQDMVIQRIEGRRYIEILEGSIRFLVLSMYKLTCTLSDYTETESPLNITISDGPVSGLNNYEMNVVREMKLTMKCLRDCLNSLIIQYQENVPESPHRPLFEAVNLIVNLPFLHGHIKSPTQFQAKSELRNSDNMFRTVFKMYREHLTGNHWAALKHLPKLIDYPLLILSYAPVIAQLQIHMIHLLKKLYSATGPNTSSVKHLCAFLCPEWLSSNDDERLKFGRFMAIQFGIYDKKRDLCDYKMAKDKILPRDFVEKAVMERKRAATQNNAIEDNETRVYAVQMVVGRDWSFYKDVVQMHGLEYILDPTQPCISNHHL